MRLIREIHEECAAIGRPAISFEFFPPKTPEGDRALLETTIPRLSALRPDYCSVTYGAGGSTREKTIEIVDRIQRDHRLTAMMHLTCVNATRAELRAVIDEARDRRGIRNILALRGDPPDLSAEWKKTEGGFEYSRELVAFVKEIGGFSIGTAAFPEGHIAQKAGKFVDWGYLREKVECRRGVRHHPALFRQCGFLRVSRPRSRAGGEGSDHPGDPGQSSPPTRPNGS